MVELCRRLVQKERVLLVPGTCFGCPQHVRLGFGCSMESTREGLQRLSRVLESLAVQP